MIIAYRRNRGEHDFDSVRLGQFAHHVGQVGVFLRAEHSFAELVRVDVAPAAEHALRELLLAHFQGKHAAGEPIVRGDVDTVKEHLRVLRGTPAAEVYEALARAALLYLPVNNKKSLKRILDSSRS